MKITAPDRSFTGTSSYGPHVIEFTDGVAEVDELDPSVRAYMQQAGYGVDGSEPADPPAQPEPADPRQLGTDGDGIEVVGTRLRDAAVDPKPEDFLPPTNAGQANPHGPEVVAPEIHGSGPKGILAGEVPVGSPEEVQAQEDKETAGAEDLVEGDFDHGQIAEDAVPDVEDHGPLGLSDPGSADQGVEDAQEVAEQEAADDSTQLKGQALDDALEQAGLSKSGTADEKRARLAERQAQG